MATGMKGIGIHRPARCKKCGGKLRTDKRKCEKCGTVCDADGNPKK